MRQKVIKNIRERKLSIVDIPATKKGNLGVNGLRFFRRVQWR
jgi:hypothetical protein